MSDSRALARKVKERQKLVERIVNFVCTILDKHGERTKIEEGTGHTNTVWELKNFANFSLIGDFCMTPFGGDSVEISHHGRMVFRVYYQSHVKECRVEEFALGDWLTAFKKLMKNQKAVVAESKRKKQADQAQSKADTKDRQERERLEREAKRLKLP